MKNFLRVWEWPVLLLAGSLMLVSTGNAWAWSDCRYVSRRHHHHSRWAEYQPYVEVSYI